MLCYDTHCCFRDQLLNLISICFLPQYQGQRHFFSPEGELKKALQLTHVCNQCCGALIDNARLVAFLVLEFSLPAFQLPVYMLSCKWCICKVHDSIN